MKSRRVNIRVPEELHDELIAIQEREGFASLSDVIRQALESYIEKEAPSWNTETIEIHLPYALTDEIDMLIRAGVVSDMDQAALLAFREWCRIEEQHYGRILPFARKKLDEMAERKETELRMKKEARRLSRL